MAGSEDGSLLAQIVRWYIYAKIPAYDELSLGDKWRATRLLSQGEAPSDPAMARAVIELAEKYRSRRRVYGVLDRWWPIAAVIVFGAISIPAAIAGNVAMTIVVVLLLLGSVLHVMFNPALRPKNIARSLEASQRVLASDG